MKELIIAFYTLMIFIFSPGEESKASWYGPGFDGRITANGEIYSQDSLTCASPVLPFNTMVRVTNLKNKKSVIVRVNDRGPFHCYVDSLNKVRSYYPLEPHPERSLDLSKKAFSTISKIERGVIKIKYKILKD